MSSLEELEMHAHTARKLLDNNEWVPSRLLWHRLTGHLEAALAVCRASVPGVQPVAWRWRTKGSEQNPWIVATEKPSFAPYDIERVEVQALHASPSLASEET